MLWRWAGDRRLAFTGLSAGILQLMHPAIGAGVVEHSAFFTDPWDRIFRSIPEIIGTVYDWPDPEATGHRVRSFHTQIKGVDAQGRQYHALDPETYWWAHVTIYQSVVDMVDRFDGYHLTAADRERMYAESVTWYRRYGVSSRPVPADHAGYRAKWDRICAEVLEMTPAAERAVDMALHSRIDRLPNVPAVAWPLTRYGVTPVLRLAAIGGLPAAVRARFAIPWSAADELELRALATAVREGWRFMPPPLRHIPRAAAGRRRAAEDLEAATAAA